MIMISKFRYLSSLQMNLPFMMLGFPFSKIKEEASLDLIVQRLKINVDKSQQLEKALIDASLGENSQHINQDKARI